MQESTDALTKRESLAKPAFPLYRPVPRPVIATVDVAEPLAIFNAKEQSPPPTEPQPAETPLPVNYNPFLPLRPKPLSCELRDSIHEAFRDLNLDMDDLTPHRVKVAYRICRDIAILTKQCLPDQSLEEALEPQLFQERSFVDKWYEICDIPQASRYYSYDLLSALKRVSATSILPPHIPLPFRTSTGKANNKYDPTDANHDPLLWTYIAVVDNTYRKKQIDQGSTKEPMYGHYGFIGLTDPHQIRTIFPSKEELLAFERVLISETLAQLTEHGTRGTVDWLFTELGFQEPDAIKLVRMARQHSTTLISGDIEEDKRVMILRLEGLAKKARDRFDDRTELQILKQMALVQGITRMEASDMETEVASYITRWRAKQPPLVQPPEHLDLPAPAKKITSRIIDSQSGRS